MGYPGLKLAGGVVLMVVLVMVIPIGRLATAAPSQQDDGVCYPDGTWCYFDDSLGQMRCEVSSQCQSEGSEEEGAEDCTPGRSWDVRTCEEDCRCTVCTYFCSSEGEWTSAGECVMVGISDEHCFDRACLREPGGAQATCWDLPGNDTPCEDVDWGASGIQCLGEYGLNVSVSVPCVRVRRAPYPRGLVTVPNVLWLAEGASGTPTSVTAWSDTLGYNACLNHSDIGSAFGDGTQKVRNLQIGLRWVRRTDVPPVWETSDGMRAVGAAAAFTWPYSSYGEPRGGIGLYRERLPAFKVDLTTYWTLQWNVKYELQKKEAPDWGECGCTGGASNLDDNAGWRPCDGDQPLDRTPGERGTPPAGLCVGADEWWGAWWEGVQYCDDDGDDSSEPPDRCWEQHEEGWTDVDLTRFGYPTSYFISRAAGPVPTWLEPNPACNGVYVPVIEVQGVISNPRWR